MSSKRTDPEADVFREAMRDVKPIDVRARVPPTKRKPPAKARFTAADRAMVLVESLKGFGEGEITDTGDEISFRRAGVQDSVMRKLKSGDAPFDKYVAGDNTAMSESVVARTARPWYASIRCRR